MHPPNAGSALENKNWCAPLLWKHWTSHRVALKTTSKKLHKILVPCNSFHLDTFPCPRITCAHKSVLILANAADLDINNVITVP